MNSLLVLVSCIMLVLLLLPEVFSWVLSLVVIFVHSSESIGTSERTVSIFFPALDCLVGVAFVAETNTFSVLVFGTGEVINV